MANISILEFQQSWSNQTESLGQKYRDTIQHPNAYAVIKCVSSVFIAAALKIRN
jgi:hypothetical protein